MSARWTFPSIFREFRAGTSNESEAAIFHGHVTDVNSAERIASTTQPSIVLFWILRVW